MFNMISLDGYFEVSDKWDLSWHQVDQEFDGFTIEQLREAGGIIFGRVTYEGMASFWQSDEAFKTDPIVAEMMNSLPKFVFSKTIRAAEWNNAKLITGDATNELVDLKMQSGKDLFIFGSSELSTTFIEKNLIDEFRLMVNPVVLGCGGSLFKENNGTIKLKLLKVRTFHNGNILLHYSPG